MKPVAVFILVAVFSVAAVAANAKTVIAQGNSNDQTVAALAGPAAAVNASHTVPDKRSAADQKAKAQTKTAKTARTAQAENPAPVPAAD